MSGQGRKWALAAGLPWHFARLAGQAAFAAGPGAGRAPRKVLILGYGAVGDLIFLMPMLRALRRGLPGARLVFLGDDDTGTRELLPATDLVHEIWRYTHAHLALSSVRSELRRRVEAEGFDAVVAGGGAPMRALASAALAAPLRVGHCRPLRAPHRGWSQSRYALWRLRRGVVTEEFERRLAFNRKVWTTPESEHSVRRNLRLSEALGLAYTAEDDAPPRIPCPEAARLTAEKAVPAGRPAVVLHLGPPTTQYAKFWPAERWAKTARALIDHSGARLALIGGRAEAETARAFAKAFGGDYIDLIGKLSLLESFAVIGRCALFLGHDAGPAKAAMAMGVPTACVWGPTSIREQGAYWETDKHLELSRGLPCSPCVHLAVRDEGGGVLNLDNCGHRACLADLSVNDAAGRIVERFGAALAA